MTLKEKFKKEGFSNYDYLSNVADEFAIEFAEWLNVNAYKYPTKTTTKELLEIYKKEKRL